MNTEIFTALIEKLKSGAFFVCFTGQIIDFECQFLRNIGDYLLKQDKLVQIQLSQFREMLPSLISNNFTEI
jgi:hypothetical protein